MTTSPLERLFGENAIARDLFDDKLGVKEPADLASHWSVATPHGRAWLRAWLTHEAGMQVQEPDILRWAFAAELMALGESIMPADKALSFVGQGITLRDIKSKPAQALAERRWNLVADLVKEQLPETGDLPGPAADEGAPGWAGEGIEALVGELEDRLHEPLPVGLPPAADAPADWAPQVSNRSQLEAWVKDDLVSSFERLRKETQRAELRLLGVDEVKDQDLLIEQGLTWHEIRVKPERELTERLLATEVLGDSAAAVTKALQIGHEALRSVSDADARAELVRRGLDALGELADRARPITEMLTDSLTEILDEGESRETVARFVNQMVRDLKTSLGTYLDPTILDELPRALEALPAAKDPKDEAQIRQWLLQYMLEAGLLGRVRSWKRMIEQAERDNRGICRVGFYDLLVVSDFHVAAGNYPSPDGLARLSPTEDFFFDDACFRALHHCEQERRQRDAPPYELVFNGDMIDFVQVVISDDRKELESWAVPPLWLEEQPGASDSLPDRLYRQLERVWANEPDQFAAIVNGQEKVYKTTERKYAGWMSMAQAKGRPGIPGDRDAVARDLVAQVGKVQTGTRAKDIVYRQRREEKLADWASAAWTRQAVQKRAERSIEKPIIREMGRKDALGQLADVYFGHPRLFQGLAWFLAQGNRLVVIRGNHDPQWYWPEVQLAFVGWLKTAYDDLRRTCRTAAGFELPVSVEQLTGHLPNRELVEIDLAFFEGQVDFDHGWYYYREGLAYIEHGGQHDAINSYRYFLTPVEAPPKKKARGPNRKAPAKKAQGPNLEIPAEPLARAVQWLPELAVDDAEERIHSSWGNVGAPLVNSIEIELPNFDRPDYLKVYLPELIYRRPGFVIRTWLKSTFDTGKALAKWMTHRPSKWVRDSQIAKRQAYAQFTGLDETTARALDETEWARRWRKGYGPTILGRLRRLWVPALLAFLAGGWVYFKTQEDYKMVWGIVGFVVTGPIFYWITTAVSEWINLGEDYLFKPSQEVAKKFQDNGWTAPDYILFGHDHVRNAQRLENGSWYLNTGSWLHKYATERKRLVREPLEYSFVRMTDTHHVLVGCPDDAEIAYPEVRPRVELLRWNDNGGRVEPCETFQGTTGRKGAHP